MNLECELESRDSSPTLGSTCSHFFLCVFCFQLVFLILQLPSDTICIIGAFIERFVPISICKRG